MIDCCGLKMDSRTGKYGKFYFCKLCKRTISDAKAYRAANNIQEVISTPVQYNRNLSSTKIQRECYGGPDNSDIVFGGMFCDMGDCDEDRPW